jgi:hypothetical protein
MNSKASKTMYLIIVLAFLISTCSNTNADFAFGEPVNMGPIVNSSAWDGGPSVTADGLLLFFDSFRPGGVGRQDIWFTTRETTDDEWAEPVNLGRPVNSSADEWAPSISADGLSLYFGVGWHLWVTTRQARDDAWGTPVNLGSTINSSSWDIGPSISADGLSLFFSSNRPGGSGGMDIWLSTRETKDNPWGTPMNLGPIVNSSFDDAAVSISADGLSLLFIDYPNQRPGGYGGPDIWVTMRATTKDPWSTPVNLGSTVNSASRDDAPGELSPDGSTLYCPSNRPGGSGNMDLWQVSIEPIVDLNSDGIVDSADMSIFVDYWGTDEPLCDIGPTPFGDGIVDTQDLIVLAEHLFEEPGLIAHWKLDETEGIIAQDNVGGNDAYLVGEPLWQPTGGMVGGAIGLDGVDDCVISDFVLNPTEKPFSVFAWVKGGSQGQVILSQIGGSTWLSIDSSDGNLITEIKAVGRGGASTLRSEVNITDGSWHRIGLVWNGSNRILYVDDIEVARDTKAGLEGSNEGLYIGTGKVMEAGTFWSGLIDDVRIYNRAVNP